MAAALSPREEYWYKAKVAELTETYDDMVEFMKKVSAEAEANSEDLTEEERGLLSTAYENLIAVVRASWRIISSMEEKEESGGDDEGHVSVICDYRYKIESELSKICDSILELLDSRLIPLASSDDSKNFYLKMKDDYDSYAAEFNTGVLRRKESAKSSTFPASPREKYMYMAKLAEKAERYHEMVEFMEKVSAEAEANREDLTVEERNLLYVAYKNMIGERRASWRIISAIEQEQKNRGGHEEYVAINGDYRSKIESELCNICDDILSVLDSRLIPCASSGESKVFFLKMKGNYHRYLAEFKTGSQRKESVESTLLAYKCAQDIANRELAPTHPTRLGLALNFCVFYYEILNSPERACKLANKALDEATAELDNLDDDESLNDTTSIMQLLRDNITVCSTSDTQDDGSN